uniref:Glutaredoxin domain-containing protein n=1 Tax=Graphocephala atropunctata TaxID=36148 RepID=A0A1B6MGW8_9HEMI
MWQRYGARSRLYIMKALSVCVLGGLALVGVGGDSEQDIRNMVESSSVVLFTKPGCSYCSGARELLGLLPCRTLEVPLDTPELQTALWNLTGSLIVPQIFVGGRFFGGYADLIKALGHGQLFSATSAPNSATPLATEDHVGLYKLIRSSENAIRWISNKTTSSLNELLHVQNDSSLPTSTESPSSTEKLHFLEWLKAAVKDPLAEDELEESTTAGESGESIVFAHRTAERGFAWGPPGQNTSADAAKGNTTKSLTERVHSVLQVLYLGIRGLADRCKTLIQAGLTKVFAKKDPFLMRKYASESIEKQLDDLEKNNGSHGARDVMFACDDNMKPVCAVDVDSHYTIFQNECKMVQFNYRYGTNFSIHNKDVCMDLFASKPALFYQSPTIQPPV